MSNVCLSFIASMQKMWVIYFLVSKETFVPKKNQKLIFLKRKNCRLLTLLDLEMKCSYIYICACMCVCVYIYVDLCVWIHPYTYILLSSSIQVQSFQHVRPLWNMHVPQQKACKSCPDWMYTECSTAPLIPPLYHPGKSEKEI